MTVKGKGGFDVILGTGFGVGAMGGLEILITSVATSAIAGTGSAVTLTRKDGSVGESLGFDLEEEHPPVAKVNMARNAILKDQGDAGDVLTRPPVMLAWAVAMTIAEVTGAREQGSHFV